MICPSILSRLHRLPAVRFFAAAAAFGTLSCPANAEDIVWNFGTADPGSAAPAASPANLTVSSVAQGNNNGTTLMLTAGSAASAAYPGASQSYNAQMATPNGAFDAAMSGYFEVTLTPAATYRVTLTEVAFGTRRTNTGPQNYSIRTSADSYAIPAGSGALPAASTWGYLSNPGMGVTSATPLTIRIYGIDGAGAAVNTAVWRIDDLKLSVIVAQEGTPSPAISDVSPLAGTVGTAVTITGTEFGTEPVVRFSGTLAPGSTVNAEGTSISVNVPPGTPAGPGPVTVTTNGGAASGPQPFDVIPRPGLTVAVNPDTVDETAINPASAGTVSVPSPLAEPLIVTLANNQAAAVTVPGSVTIPAGDLSASFDLTVIPNPASFASVTATITASAAGHDEGSATLRVRNTDALPTTVVVNKYLNAGGAGLGDTVELLVIGDGTPGSTADLRRMLLKDHSASMGGDNGGKYRFNDIAAFSAVKAGTLIVITDSASTPVPDPSKPVLRLGLLDTTYFTREGSTTFDISGTEMIMIKGQDAPADGGEGAVHSLAGGVAGTEFTEAGGKKLIASGASGTGFGVVANNSTSSLADYDGSDATGGVAAATLTFGGQNNNANNTYIRSLLGITSVDGAGLASITNGDAASPLAGRNFFPRNTPAQTAVISLISNAGPAAVTSVKVSVPAAFGAPIEANISVSGTGAGTPAITVAGQDITITGTAITTADGVVIAVAGLTAPNPAAITDDGRYTFAIQTAGDAGVLTGIASQPVALVAIPVANVRDVDTNGIALDAGKTVAIEIVCTEEDFDSAARTSAYGQDGDFGINIFVPAIELNLVRGRRYAITGQIIQFSGLTEIAPGSAANVVDLGAGVEPAPLTITVPELLANPEAYEGRLIKIVALNYIDGTWGLAQTVDVADALANEFDVRIQSGSEATTPPSWPATITGICGQFDDALPGPGYQIMPRNDADVESLGGGPGYDGWAMAYPGIGGPEVDADGDGASNLMEYATGSTPNDGKSLPLSLQTLIGPTLTVTWAKGATAAADTTLAWSIEASTSMAPDTWSAAGVLNFDNGATAVSGDYALTPGEPKAFLRLKVVRTP